MFPFCFPMLPKVKTLLRMEAEITNSMCAHLYSTACCVKEGSAHLFLLLFLGAKMSRSFSRPLITYSWLIAFTTRR